MLEVSFGNKFMSEQQIITVDFIIDTLKEYVETKQPVSPQVWVEAAQKLNVLLGDEHDKMFDLQQKVAQLKVDYLNDDEKRNVSKAKMLVEASEDYKELCKLKAKVGRIEEFIRIAKIQARLKDGELKGY